jgi:hypothetical protein
MPQGTSQTDTEIPPPTVWKRVAWLVSIWAASVSTLAVVVEVIRLCMSAIGLKTH